MAHTSVIHPGLSPIVYNAGNLNIAPPKSLLQGTGDYVQSIPVKALSRTHTKITPQFKEVVPQLRIIEQTYQVDVPKPVYHKQKVTPVETRLVPKPYAVHETVQVPVPHPVPYHAGHQVSHVPVTAHLQPVAAAAQVVPIAQQYAALQVPIHQQAFTQVIHKAD